MKNELAARPWIVRSHGHGDWTIYSGKNVIGEFFGDNDEYEMRVSGEANARMAASAPIMHDALEALLNHYVSLINSGDAGSWNPEEEDIVIEARRALAKAKGEL